MEFSFSSGVDPEVFEDGDPEKKFDIRDPSDMAIPPLRAKAPEGGEGRCEGNDEGGMVVHELQLGARGGGWGMRCSMRRKDSRKDLTFDNARELFRV